MPQNQAKPHAAARSPAYGPRLAREGTVGEQETMMLRLPQTWDENRAALPLAGKAVEG
jgi:hypothetical protein